MRWYFRDISDDPSEKELTQQDQFNNDEVALAEALVRETIQNSTDAQASSDVPVRVRFAIADGVVDRTLSAILDGLSPHLRAANLPVARNNESLRLLVVEDFGTTGLSGSVEIKDDGQFSGFWRRFGRSNKEGAKGGRWGLGKLVFPSASGIRSIIGLTQRLQEGDSWIMGQAILRNHVIDGRECDSVGFWCRSNGPRPGLPTDDAHTIATVKSAAGLARRSEPGLSLIVPDLLSDITEELLIAATIRNYYFPILTGRLSVEINDTVIDAKTFESLAESVSGGVTRSVLDFVRALDRASEQEPLYTLPATWQTIAITADLLGDATVTNLREQFRNGDLLRIRAPLTVRSKDGSEDKTYVDAYLRRASPGEKTQTLVVRGSITVPTEGRKFLFADCNGALVARDIAISRLLGDAENPAHTQWNERADKLRAGWQSGRTIVRKVRSLLPELHALVTERVEQVDPLALLEFFSIPKDHRQRGAANVGQGRPKDLPSSDPKPFRIEKRASGFAILPGPSIANSTFPFKLRVRCAYDVLTGDPFSRFSRYDFTFYGAGLKVEKKGAAQHVPTDANQLDVEISGADFRVDVLGFDSNRDLIIEAEG